MFRIDKNTNKIHLTRGDSAAMKVIVRDGDGNIRPLQSGDALIFKMKRNSATATIALQLTAVNGEFTFIPGHTSNLTPGAYVYDVQLTTAGGSVFTVVPLSSFDLMEEVC